ncbi:hypothetical protein OQA88_2426 [Cercophora sp. LCS_1]
MSTTPFDPKDLPGLAKKVILITGGTAGVGAATLVTLARHNLAHLLFTGRNGDSAKTSIANVRKFTPDINITFIQCDLANLDSVEAASTNISSQLTHLDVLVCNAGIMAKPAALSSDGYETHFATNHLGHALLARKLIPVLQKSSSPRIVMVTSVAWRGTPPGGIAFDRLKTTQEMPILGRWLRYGQSKLANMLYARELAKKYPDILAFSITPGVVETGLVTDLGKWDKALVYIPNVGRVKTVEQGTHNLLWAIFVDKNEVERGAFYEPVGKKSNMETSASKNPVLGERLWDWTENELERFM